MTVPSSSWKEFVSNPDVVKFIGDVLMDNDRVFLDLSEEEMHVILNILQDRDYTKKPLSRDYYGLLKQLGIGHHWLFGDDFFVDPKTVGRYVVDTQVSSFLSFTFAPNSLHIYRVTGSSFYAKSFDQHVKVTFRGHIKEVVDLGNDLGGGAGKDSSVGGAVSSDDAAPIKRNPVPGSDPSVDASEGSGC